MNCVINALILPLQFFFKNKVRYVHQLQSGNLRNQITKLPIRKVNGKIFSYSTVVARIKIQKNFIPIFVIVVIVLVYSFYQPLLHVGSVFCVFVVVLYWYRCGSVHVILIIIIKQNKKEWKTKLQSKNSLLRRDCSTLILG